MPSVDFNDFTEKTSAQPTDYLVGYDVNASNGEKKWDFRTVARSVSALAKDELQKGVLSKIGSSITPAADFNTFTAGSNAIATDNLVGFTNTSAGGERKWTLSTLAVTLSSLMEQAILNKVMTTIGNYPYVLLQYDTARGVDGFDPPDSNYFTVPFNTKVEDLNNICTLNSSLFELNAGVYMFETYISTPINNNAKYAIRLRNMTTGNTIRDFVNCQLNVSQLPSLVGKGQFTVTNSTNDYAIQVADAGNARQTPLDNTTTNGREILWQLHLWKVG